MRNLIIVGRVCVLILMGLMVPSHLSAQQATAASNMFPTQAACVASLGKVPYYDPLFLGNVKKNPTNGSTSIVAPLEEDACLHMVTMRGWQWVPLKRGALVRWQISANGTRTPFALDKCGNSVDGIAYPSAPLNNQLSIRATGVDTLVVVHTGTVNVHHSGEVILGGPVGVTRPQSTRPEDYRNEEPEKKNGFDWWCNRGAGHGFTCGAAALAGILVAKNNWPHHNEPEGKKPGGNTGPAFQISF